MRILGLMLTLTVSIFTYASSAAEEWGLVTSEGFYRFPFFTTDTPVWQYNKQTPGPIIKGREGESLRVNLVNGLNEPTTVHWHGLRVENSMDGVPGVTQDAVQPGASHLYSLDLEEAGTYWYHPHFNNSEQLERGLKGVLIVEEKEPQDWSRELILFLDDWLLQKDGTIYPHFNTPHDLMHDGRWGNVPTVNARVKPEFVVNPGERIRVRLINGANARVFRLGLSGLPAQVIAIDGRPVTELFVYQGMNLSPGNRIDLDITIPDDGAGTNYIIEDLFTRSPFELAKIRISERQAIDPPSFIPHTAPDFLPAALFDDVKIGKTWDLGAFRGGKLGIGWGMNHKLWPDSDKADFELGQPQKIVFKNSSGRLHPMHIHGVFFRVLARNGKPAVEPFTRDTVLIGPRETVVIGLIPEHRGIWAIHCHILEHAEAGMMSTIQVTGKIEDAGVPVSQ